MGGKRSMPAAPGHYPGHNALYFTKHYFTKTRTSQEMAGTRLGGDGDIPGD
jgi:hypothetical protein